MVTVQKSGGTVDTITGNYIWDGDVITTISTPDEYWSDDSITGGSTHYESKSGTGLAGGTSFADSDSIVGYAGNDTLVGGHESDTLEGGKGNDYLFGGADPTSDTNDFTDYDSSVYDDPNDGDGSYTRRFGLNYIDRDAGADFIDAGEGDDIAYGAQGDDTIYGSLGDDYLNGGDDDDSLSGGSGDDVLISGDLSDGQRDTLTGGSGQDTFILGQAYSGDVTPGEVAWADLGESVTTDFTNLILSIPGVSTPLVLLKSVIPMGYKTIQAIMGADSAVEDPLAGSGEYATVSDFNPREDVVIVPVNATGNSSVLVSADSTLDSDMALKYSTDSDDTFAVLNFSDDFTGSTLNYASREALGDQLQETAIVMDSDGVYVNGEEVSLSTLGISDEVDLSDLGDGKYMVLGAFSGHLLEGDNSSNYLYGTDFSDTLAGYQLTDDGDGQSSSAVTYLRYTGHC